MSASRAKAIEGHARSASEVLIQAGANVREMLIEADAYGEIDPVVFNNTTCALFSALNALQIIVDLSRDIAREEVKP